MIRQDPSRLLVVVRSPLFALNGAVMHAPVEVSSESEVWWIETSRVARLLHAHGITRFLG